MDNSHYRYERRLDRRIPMGTAAIISLPGGNEIKAHCIELGVKGLTLRSTYVPSQNEQFEVRVYPPDGTNSGRPPFHALVEVKRCHAENHGDYVIGAAVVRVLG